MLITIKRPPITEATGVISTLSINGIFFCHCIEDRDRGIYQTDDISYINSIKVKHETAIPYGTYQLVMSFSNRFQKFLPELLDVKGFSGIRIHPGNTEADSSGCILPGIKEGDRVVNSRITMANLMKKIDAVLKKEKIFVEVIPTTIDNHNLSNPE